MSDKCKICEVSLETHVAYTSVNESGELAIVDRRTQEAYALNKDDRLCNECGKNADYYRRIR